MSLQLGELLFNFGNLFAIGLTSRIVFRSCLRGMRKCKSVDYPEKIL